MEEVLVVCKRNERCFPGKCVLFHKIWWHGDWETAQSWCLVPPASSTPKLLDLVGSIKTSCPFPSTTFLNLLSDILSYTLVQQLLVFSHFFSKFQALQLSVRNRVKNGRWSLYHGKEANFFFCLFSLTGSSSV